MNYDVSANSSTSVLANTVGNASARPRSVQWHRRYGWRRDRPDGASTWSTPPKRRQPRQIVGNFSTVLDRSLPCRSASVSSPPRSRRTRRSSEEIAQAVRGLDRSPTTSENRRLSVSHRSLPSTTLWRHRSSRPRSTSGRTLQAMDALDIKASDRHALAALDQDCGRIAFFENWHLDSDRWSVLDDSTARWGRRSRSWNFATSTASPAVGRPAGDFVQDNRAMIEALEQRR